MFAMPIAQVIGFPQFEMYHAFVNIFNTMFAHLYPHGMQR
jgi:hypothetical protein